MKNRLLLTCLLAFSSTALADFVGNDLDRTNNTGVYQRLRDFSLTNPIPGGVVTGATPGLHFTNQPDVNGVLMLTNEPQAQVISNVLVLTTSNLNNTILTNGSAILNQSNRLTSLAASNSMPFNVVSGTSFNTYVLAGNKFTNSYNQRVKLKVSYVFAVFSNATPQIRWTNYTTAEGWTKSVWSANTFIGTNYDVFQVDMSTNDVGQLFVGTNAALLGDWFIGQ